MTIELHASRIRCALAFRPGRLRSRLPGRCSRLPALQVPRSDFGFARLAVPRAAVLLRRAHPLENLGEPEVDLAPLHVDLDDLHARPVAEPVHPPGVLSAQDVRTLDEPVVVVGHRRDVDHALDEVLDQLDEQAERRHAGDVAVELVADLVGHEADLLPLHQLALGVVGAPLALGRVPGDLRQVVGQLLAAIRPSSPCRDSRSVRWTTRSGIAADRRREVRVALGRQAEVPEVLTGRSAPSASSAA